MPIVASTAATANAVTAWAARSARPWLERAARWTPCAPTLRGSAGAAVARAFRESFDMRRGELRRGERGQRHPYTLTMTAPGAGTKPPPCRPSLRSHNLLRVLFPLEDLPQPFVHRPLYVLGRPTN